MAFVPFLAKSILNRLMSFEQKSSPFVHLAYRLTPFSKTSFRNRLSPS
nr:MAG TPA: hypothetical protein [Caudoviricetes sp.]